MILRDVLPEIYTKLQLGSWLNLTITEKTPTCDNCLASRPERGKVPYYDAKLKCCTYHPFLPNYLIGALLVSSSTAPFVLELLKAKEKAQSYLLPIGALPPVRFQVLFNNREEGEFGNRPDWLCPYYDTKKNNCGIWQYRGATCSTYFCISDHGKAGLKFWSNLSELLNLIEIRLAESALRHFGYSDEEILCQFEYFNCTDGTEEELSSDSLSPALWNQYWAGRNLNVLDFYKQTYEAVANLTLEDLKKDLLDGDFRKMESKLQKVYNKIYGFKKS
jgi:Fe-S-cluster containining protein